MAGSDIDIVNMALGFLGDRAGVADFSEGTPQADAAKRVYAQVRDWMLERFPWKFALRRTTLAQRSDLTFTAWLYAYAEPGGSLRILTVLPEGYTKDDQGADFETESDATGQSIILTNAQNATVRYIARVTDPGKFTPGFTEALAWYLATSLAGPIIKGETGRQEQIRCLQIAGAAFASAAGLSANQAKLRLDFIPEFILARTGALTPDRGGFIARS